jgi:hypothetical protein
MNREVLKTNAVTIILMAISIVAWLLFGIKGYSIIPALVMTTLQGIWLYKIL